MSSRVYLLSLIGMKILSRSSSNEIGPFSPVFSIRLHCNARLFTDQCRRKVFLVEWNRKQWRRRTWSKRWVVPSRPTIGSVHLSSGSSGLSVKSTEWLSRFSRNETSIIRPQTSLGCLLWSTLSNVDTAPGRFFPPSVLLAWYSLSSEGEREGMIELPHHLINRHTYHLEKLLLLWSVQSFCSLDVSASIKSFSMMHFGTEKISSLPLVHQRSRSSQYKFTFR